MIRFSVDEISKTTGAEVLVGSDAPLVGEVLIDSRRLSSGDMFVAFAGERVDGNAFARGAVDAGAGAVVLSADPEDGLLEAARERGCAVFRAADDDCEAFLMKLAAEWRARHPEWFVVGVTGSVGKTTTKDLLRAAFATQRRVHATAGNLNNLLGLPLTVLATPEDAEVLILEMGMNHMGEISRMTRCARPTLACITNVGTSHIGLLGSREGIARAKAEICEGMQAFGETDPCLAITSSNDFAPLIEDLAAASGVEVIHVGTHDSDDVCLSDYEPLGASSRYVYRLADGTQLEGELPIPGRHVLDDLALALALVGRAGLDVRIAADALASLERTGMRLDVKVSSAGVTVIDDSYNASPSSMAAALDVLRSLPVSGRRVAVLGEMGEMGDEAPRLHALVGAYAAATSPDILVLIGDALAAEIAEGALAVGFSGDCIERFASVDDALQTMGPIFADGDAVLVKASRSAGLDRFAKGVMCL